MESWVNGEMGSKVKQVIDNNFDILDKRTIKLNDELSKNIEPISKKITKTEWGFTDNLKTYTIFIPYTDYEKETPCVEVYFKNGGGYSSVYGGAIIEERGITLQSDIPYEGKVVIR